MLLKLDGNWRDGFRVGLEIGGENARPETILAGNLPANEPLAELLRSHRQVYARGGMMTRISPKRAINVNYREWARDCQQSSANLRSRFREWLSQPGFQRLDLRLREALQPEEAVRLHLQCDHSEVFHLPWHCWELLERYPRAEIAFAPPELSPRYPRTARGGNLRILAILGCSQGIEVERDREFLENLPHAEVTFLVQPLRVELNDALWEREWDVLFFAGHGQTEGETGRIYVNSEEYLTVDELWFALKKATERGLQLALFNSCDGMGLVQKLDDLGIPQIAVMREAVPDPVAQAFLKALLGALSRGVSFYEAMREARERLQGMENEYPCASWLPILFQHPEAVPLQVLPKKKAIASSWRWRAAILVLGVLLSGWGWRSSLATWLNNRAHVNFRAGEWRSVERTLKNALSLDLDNAVAYYNLADLYERSRNIEAAREWYLQATKRGMVAAYARLAALEIDESELDEAQKLVAEGLILIETKGGDRFEKASLWESRGRLAWARGDFAGAKAAFEKALAVQGDRVSSRCWLEELAMREGEGWRRCPN
ncbi:MAG: CHAT domain-containing protein [Cyanobacteria bacterium P01_E01_bin.42]